MSNQILTILIAAIPLIVAVTLHEAAHGYAAWMLGDDTAKNAGRLSLNPLVHVDPIGSVLFPGFLLFIHAPFVFGWAKPVPVSPWRFPNPRRDMALVAAAGPLMNFFLAWVGALAIYAVPLLPDSAMDVAMQTIRLFLLMNISLGLFNLLPIPPLDGGRIVVGILPLRLAAIWARLERAGIVIVLLVVFLLPGLLRDLVGIRFDPVGQALRTMMPRAISLVLRLAGHDVGG